MNSNYVTDKISIQIPTKLRPEHVSKTIKSIFDKVSDIKNIEILLRMDNDDKQTIEFIKNNFAHYIDDTIKIVVGERGGGYADLSKYHYELSEISTGQWIFCFNDDLTVETQNFDLLILENRDSICILQGIGDRYNCNHNGGNFCFPIIHRKIIETLGHFTVDTPYYDGWFKVIGDKLSLHKIIPIELNHSLEILHEMDSVNLEKEIVNSTIGRQFNWSFHSESQDGLIVKDINKLKHILSI